MMADMIAENEVPEIVPTLRFQWEEAQNCYVLLYPEGMVKLNPSAAEILKHCDGTKTVSEIIGELTIASRRHLQTTSRLAEAPFGPRAS